jgi:hypothetical protein
MYKDFNARITKLQEKAELSNPRNRLKKLLQDIDNLEKFYTDREYRQYGFQYGTDSIVKALRK